MNSFTSRCALLSACSALAFAALSPAFGQGTVKAAASPAASLRALSSKRLKGLALEMMMYSQDKNAYPPMKTPAALAKALKPYGKAADASAFMQPGANRPYLGNPNLSNVPTKAVSQPQSVIAFYEAVPAPDGSRLVCTADGRIMTAPGSKWANIKRVLHLP